MLTAGHALYASALARLSILKSRLLPIFKMHLVGRQLGQIVVLLPPGGCYAVQLQAPVRQLPTGGAQLLSTLTGGRLDLGQV